MRRDSTRNRLLSFHAGIKYKNSRTSFKLNPAVFVYDPGFDWQGCFTSCSETTILLFGVLVVWDM